jgi:hypothetical protein
VEEMIPDGDAGGMDWSDDDLEETDAGVSWTSPAVKHKKSGEDAAVRCDCHHDIVISGRVRVVAAN